MQKGEPSLVCDFQDLYRYLIDDFAIAYCKNVKASDFVLKDARASCTIISLEPLAMSCRTELKKKKQTSFQENSDFCSSPNKIRGFYLLVHRSYVASTEMCFWRKACIQLSI
jgi:predicted GH43/DUF377 family glycosyl hydrolase